MVTLGVNCDPHAAYLAVVEDGRVLAGFPERLRPSTGLELGDRLLEFVSEVRRTFGAISPSRIGLLLPEGRQSGPSHTGSRQSIADRATIETLVRVGAAQEGISLNLVPRPTVRAALSLPRTGSLDSHLAAAGGSPVGQYWAAGRGLAALVALAVEVV